MAYPKYDSNKFINAGIAKAKYVNDLFYFIRPALTNLDELKQRAQIDRIRATLVQEKVDCDFNQIKRALENPDEKGDELYHRVQSYVKADKYIGQRLPDFQGNHLKKVHEILLRSTPNEQYGGILRNVDDLLVEDNKEGTAEDLMQFLIDTIGQGKVKNPIIHAFGIYLLFDIVQPFLVYNQSLSLIFFNAFLSQNQLDVNGLLVFEKSLLRDWNTHKSIKLNSLFPVSARERIQTDVTAFLENCISILNDGYLDVEDILIEALKSSVSYAQFKPIQKNSFNYFFDLGFPRFHHKIMELNERQQAILRDVILHRNVTTKSMVMKYRCDRKTIQRDFADLMEMGVVSFEGKTKTVNYHLSFS